jgi:RNA polymerase sigma-70 factor (ECF subfamily)
VAVEVRSVIALLNETDQEILRLVYWDGFSLVEAAQLLGLRPSTVRSRHARARATLRTALEAHLAPG